ncbi:MAG: DUF1512 domain-containing protein, partial [Candidatus Aenigmarchaeota archaeon]|nr:DUF1512 domain-containing protein [Candidatus Aenigmarchaeota archaeon]
MAGVLFQLGPGGDWVSWILWFFFLIIFFFFYPRLMVSQIMWKIEKTARDLERMSDSARRFVTKEISENPDKRLKDSIERFFEFFMISPISLDPYGYIPKLDHMIKNQKDRFEYFVNQVAPKMDPEKKANIQMGLAGGITVHEISKIVRHYVELVRQTKNIQIAMVLQMQLPLIEKIARAMYKGTKALSKGEPIGDGLGPLVVADLIGKVKTVEIDEDVIMAKVQMDGRTLLVMKARGPGGRIGFPGSAVQKVVMKNKVARVISVDAAAKLEGEKTGSLAEGVGVAMGGPGVERSYIEEIVVKKGIPLDSIVVKMSQEEAIMPMRKVVKDALPEVRKSIKRSLERTKRGDRVIIVGVGNTSGIGNTGETVSKVSEW